MWRSLALIALLASAQGRAVNISNTWVLPEEGFPVFYRYFRDRISWYEADAVCQFHHANLVTVDTTAQYDAVRAYLKELDISSAVWVGLIRSNPDGDFTWTDYRGLSGDGYWSSAPDTRTAPMCAAANPVADYRWEARACGGPTVASFICELPVPQWALGNEGCMVRELPALTILYLPESAAVQLNADCGLAGVKRVQCTGNVKREGLLKDLSCADEDETSSTATPTSTGISWAATTDLTTDQDATSEVTTDETTTTHEVVQPIVITATSLPQYIKSKAQYNYQTKFTDMDNFNTLNFQKNINLGGNDDHNIQSNFIPKLIDDENILNEQREKLEDLRHMQHKMIHEEIARVGNVDNIFTQPTDHFIPPLVMAKSRISDDMTVLSLAEKHAQQIAEQFNKQRTHIDHIYVDGSNNQLLADKTLFDKPLITSVKPNKINEESKKENLKSHVPKKYVVVDKYYDAKGKTPKWESKTTEMNKPITTTTTKPSGATGTTTSKSHTYHDKIDEDFAMDLTVMLKDAPLHSEEQPALASYTDDVVKIQPTQTVTSISSKTEAIYTSPTLPENKTSEQSTQMEHKVIKITVISNDDPTVNTSVFEITTKIPIFKDDTDKAHTIYPSNPTSIPTTVLTETQTTEAIKDIITESTTEVVKDSKTEYTASVTESPSTLPAKLKLENITITTTVMGELATIMQAVENKSDISDIPTTVSTTTFSNISDDIDKSVTDSIFDKMVDGMSLTFNHNESTSVESHASLENIDFNNTELHDLMEKNMTDSEEIIDANSPLLSGAYEPMHRPPRTRRPQQQNRKFNPFRILG